MRFLYIRSPSQPAVALRVNCATVADLVVAMMRWLIDDVEMVRLSCHPYVLIRRLVLHNSRSCTGALLRVVDKWDMVTGGECLVARLDGRDVEENFDIWEHSVHPFHLYEACDYRETFRRLSPDAMKSHASYFSWDGGEPGQVIYAWPKEPPKCRPKNIPPATTKTAAAEAAARKRTPLVITRSVEKWHPV